MRKIPFAIATVLVASAVNTASATDISDEKKGQISTNCSSIQFQLKNLQRDDSRNRVHLGAQYESIATNLMMNLNVRLAKNNLANGDLAAQQTTFISERNRFKDDFIGYQQELESLIKINCQERPQDFYNQLEVVRAKRADVQSSMNRLEEILAKHRNSVLSLQEDLTK